MSGDQTKAVTVNGEEGSRRLDRVLAVHVPDLSRSRLKALIVDGHVATGARIVRDPAYHVSAGETITIAVPEATPPEPLAESIPLDVVYEDDAIIVINKPAGLVVHPAAGNETGTLVNALIAHCGASLSGIGGIKRPGIVHRLDKDTTGLLVVAKTDRAHQSLSAQFADHGRTGALRRGYLALVWGAPQHRSGTIDLPIGRHPTIRQKMAVRQDGREAITHWEVLERFSGLDAASVGATLACQLETGRTHQIRVHLSHAGHPLMGDATYGAGFRTKISRLGDEARTALDALDRQALHAAALRIEHPATGEILEWNAPWPADMERLARALRLPPERRNDAGSFENLH